MKCGDMYWICGIKDVDAGVMTIKLISLTGQRPRSVVASRYGTKDFLSHVNPIHSVLMQTHY